MKHKIIMMAVFCLSVLAAKADLITGRSKVCVGQTITLSGSPSSGPSWSSGNSSIATVSSGVVTGVTTGTVYISYGTAAYLVTVNALSLPPAIAPNAALTAGVPLPMKGCFGNTVQLSGSGMTWESSNTTIASITSSGGLITVGSTAGTTTITKTNSSGCYVTATYSVVSGPGTISGSNVCIGSSVGFTGSEPGGSWWGGSETYASVNATTGIVTGISAGSQYISYVFNLSTAGTLCYVRRFTSVSSAVASITGTTSMCVGNSTTLTCSAGGGTWSSSNDLIASVSGGVVTGVSAGTAVISYVVSAGCYSTKVVTVDGAAISGSLVTVVGGTSSLAGTPSGGTWGPASGTNASVSSAGVLTGIQVGTEVITYTSTVGCSATTIATVNPSISGSASVCVDVAITLMGSPSGGSWTSSDDGIATVNSSGIVTGHTAGTCTISYAVGAFIGTAVITVNDNPAEITGATPLCETETATLSCTTGGGTWTSSDDALASISSSGVLTAGAIASGASCSATATITYSLSNGCYTITPVTIKDVASPLVWGTARVCKGTRQEIYTTNYEAFCGDYWPYDHWVSSNTAVATILPVAGFAYVVGVTGGTSTISFTRGNGCYTTKVVTVQPHADATISGDLSLCETETTTLSCSISGGVWSPTSGLAAYVTNTASGTVYGADGTTGNTPAIYYDVDGTCIGVHVTVNAIPGTIGGASCVAAPTTQTILTNSSPRGTWTSSNTAIATAAAGGVVTKVTNGTVTITYSTGCGTPATHDVTFQSTSCSGKPGRNDNTGPEMGTLTSATNYSIIPNPNNGSFYIAQSGTENTAQLKVMNYTGATVYINSVQFKNGKADLNFRDLPPGMYLLSVWDSKGNAQTFKMVVEK